MPQKGTIQTPRGSALREARLARGQTMEQAAALIGVSLGTLFRWEHNKTAPTRLGRQAIERWLVSPVADSQSGAT